jgi:TRAP-type uncharacterized transport system substrate-binding protein
MWNHSAYEVQYKCDINLIKIDGYFIKKLVIESPGEAPKLFQVIESPQKLFEELKMQLMTTFDEVNCQFLLKTLILLYKRYSSEIGPMKFYPLIILLFE